MFNVEQNGLAQMPINDTIKDTYGSKEGAVEKGLTSSIVVHVQFPDLTASVSYV